MAKWDTARSNLIQTTHSGSRQAVAYVMSGMYGSLREIGLGPTGP